MYVFILKLSCTLYVNYTSIKNIIKKSFSLNLDSNIHVYRGQSESGQSESKLCHQHRTMPVLQFRNSLILSTKSVELEKFLSIKARKIGFHVYSSNIFINFHIIFGCHDGIVLKS